MRAIKCVVSVLLMGLPLTAAAAGCEVFWQPRILAQANSTNVVLAHNRRTVATLPTDWFRKLNIINEKINTASGVDAQFLLCNSAQPNALAWSHDGQHFVALTLGMYRLLGDDLHAYAAILGHENAHLVKQHGNKRQNRQALTALGQLLSRALVAKTFGSATTLGYEGIRIGTQAITASYSREEEHEADKYGMRYAHQAGFYPRGALSFHEKMKSAATFLSSHPSSTDRIRKLKAELKKRGW